MVYKKIKIIKVNFSYLLIGDDVNEEKKCIKNKVMFYVLSNIICCVVILDFLSKQLFPVIYDYGIYQCNNFMSNIITYSINNQFDEKIHKEIIVNSNNQIDINVAILNSICCSIIMKSKRLLYELEQGVISADLLEMLEIQLDNKNIGKGIAFYVPLGRVLENIFINNLGVMVPVRYKLIGELIGQVVTVVKEYGINNALIEVNLEITYKAKISVPMISKEEQNKISIPIIMRVVQGEVPDYLLGTNILRRE